MTENSTHIQPKRSTGARIALIVTATLAGLMSSAAFLVGGLALWGDSETDKDGYLSTSDYHMTANGHALASENLDIELDDADLFEGDDFGKLRLQVESQDGKPLFAGIARTGEVNEYLQGVAHTTVDDLDDSPFDESSTAHSGERRPSAPADAGIWAASSQGAGEQTVTWDVEDGDWSLVVMNADGSRNVDADVSVGAKVTFLDELGWTAIGAGTALLVTAIGLTVLAVRPPRGGSGGAPAPAAVPAAA
jgi:hypothetical protein